MEQNKTDITNKYIRLLMKFLPLFPVLALVIAFGISVGLIFDFDMGIGYFNFGSPWLFLLSAGIILSAVLAAIFGIAAKEKFSLSAFPPATPLSTFASYFAGIMALVLFVMDIYDAVYLSLGTSSRLSMIASLLLPAITVSMILGCYKKTRQSVVRIVFTMLAALSVNLTMFACYFDSTLAINSPVRNMITIAQAAILLFLLSEARLSISLERATAPFMIFTAAISASAALGISIGLLIFRFDAQADYGFRLSAYRYACYVAIGLLAFTRLLSLKKVAGEYVKPPKDGDNDSKESDASVPATKENDDK